MEWPLSRHYFWRSDQEKKTSMNTQSSTSMSTKDWLMVITLAAIWGGSFLLGRVLMLEWPPLTTAFLRVFLAAIALWIFLAATRRKFPLEGGFIVAIVIMGLVNNAIPFSLILIGQQEIGSSLASVVNAMTPIWTLVIANFFTTDEKFSANKILGIVFGFAGVTTMMGADILNGLAASAWAQAAVLGATISYGVAGVFGKRFRGRDPVVVSTGQLTASSVLMLPVILMMENPFSIQLSGFTNVLSILALAVVCTSFAYILFFKVLASAGAVNLSLVTFLVPVTAILLGILLLGETLTGSQLTGISLIAMGLTLIDGRFHRHILARFNTK